LHLELAAEQKSFPPVNRVTKISYLLKKKKKKKKKSKKNKKQRKGKDYTNEE
jgi:hypothetical protein